MLLAAAGLAACGDATEPSQSGDLDPVVQRALNDPIMVDADLVSQSLANSALSFEVGQPLPAVDSSPSVVIAAREEALAMLGGSSGLTALPDARSAAALTPAEALNAIGRSGRLALPAGCIDSARYSAIWAARLPDALAIYPRGNTVEALGADTGSCRLRAVLYLTPVPRDDVLAFHHTNLVKRGFRGQLFQADDWQILSGANAKARYEVTIRELPSGLTEVGIVSIEL